MSTMQPETFTLGGEPLDSQQQENLVSCGGWYVKARDEELRHGPLFCKKWTCPNIGCGPAKLKYYYALFCNGLNVTSDNPDIRSQDVMLLTLTTDIKKWSSRMEAWQQFGYLFKKFRERIYYHYGKFAYISVTEATKDGWPHMHIVTRGLAPIEQGWYEEYRDKSGKWRKVTNQEQKIGAKYRIVKYDSLDGKPTLSQMADESGFGFVCDIRSVKFDTNKGAANYLLGYLQKSLDRKSYPPNFRRVRWSKDWPSEKWENKETLAGLGLHVRSQEDALILKRYIEKGMNDGFHAGFIIASIQEIGVKPLLSRLRSENYHSVDM